MELLEQNLRKKYKFWSGTEQILLVFGHYFHIKGETSVNYRGAFTERNMVAPPVIGISDLVHHTYNF